jgi:excisionase family DNA binding protein
MMSKTYTSENNDTIAGRHTVAEAAELLHVSKVQVTRLIQAGSLRAIRPAGRAFLIDAISLNEYLRYRKSKGRAFAPNTAWAALWMLSGLSPDWLPSYTYTRVSKKLTSTSPEEILWLTRRRSESCHLRVSSSFLDRLKAEISLTGMSAPISSAFGLTASNRQIEGYIAAERLSGIIEKYHAVLQNDSGANVRLHTVKDAPFLFDDFPAMPNAVVAADLATSIDAREHSVGLEILGGLLKMSEDERTAGQDTLRIVAG